MKSIRAFIKKEVVLTVAWCLAVVSCVLVHPDKQYIEYIDFRSLGILWSLMVIMQGFKTNGVFEKIGHALLKQTKRVWQLNAVLVFLCFFSSMIITNDVALITFVPFAIMMLRECDREDLMIPVITLQTVATNLGSMLTPLGNPQNLYLYGFGGMNIGEFVKCMLPYSLVSMVLIIIHMFFVSIKGRKNGSDILEDKMNLETGTKQEVNTDKNKTVYRVTCYTGLFILALLVVLKIIPYYIVALTVLIVVAVIELNSIKNVDYSLLFTFVGFFIFTGNMGRISVISDWLSTVVAGKEIIAGALTSQCISNVPAALLLSGFTDNIKGLLIGVNIGGLGTLIASMASLISFKAYVVEYRHNRPKYFLYFTITNVIYLIVLLLYALISMH